MYFVYVEVLVLNSHMARESNKLPRANNQSSQTTILLVLFGLAGATALAASQRPVRLHWSFFLADLQLHSLKKHLLQ